MALSKKDKKTVSELVTGFTVYYQTYCDLLDKGYNHPERQDWRDKFGEDKTDWYRSQIQEIKRDLGKHGIHIPLLQA